MPGPKGRRDARCPYCGSLERHRALWLYLTRNTAFARGGLRMLVVSPRPFPEAEARRSNPEYLSIDLDPALAMRQMDLTALELPDEDRDLVIAYHVLEHIPDDRAAMREIRRVLRSPDGIALIEVPLGPGDETDERYMHAPPDVRARHYGQEDHVRLYGRADLEARLRSCGLAPLALRVGDVLADEVERCRLDATETFYVARVAERLPPPAG